MGTGDRDWDKSVAAHRAQYRGRIVAAAAELAAEHGLAGLTMAGLAERAGIGRATLYKYFPDIEHVLLAHLEDEFTAFADGLRGTLADESDPVAGLRTYIATTMHYFASQRHQKGSATFAAGSLSPKVESSLESHLAALHEPLQSVLAAGVESGDFRQDVDPRTHTWLVFAVLGGLRRPLMTGAMTPEQGTEAVWQFIMEGLRGP